MISQPRPRRERDEKYLAWIRTQPCVVHAIEHQGPCGTGIDAHHVRAKGHGGVGTKPSDYRAVPLCRNAHQIFHDFGRELFEAEMAVDLEVEIYRLNADYQKLFPSLRKERKPRTTVKLNVQHCPLCNQSHQSSLKRAQFKKDKLFIWCDRKRDYAEVVM